MRRLCLLIASIAAVLAPAVARADGLPDVLGFHLSAPAYFTNADFAVR
jgi:hypothetical protein